MDTVENVPECLLLVTSVMSLAYLVYLSSGAFLGILNYILNHLYDLIAIPAVHMLLIYISIALFVLGLLYFAFQAAVVWYLLLFCRDPDKEPANHEVRAPLENQLLALSWNIQNKKSIEESHAWRIPLPGPTDEETNALADPAVAPAVQGQDTAILTTTQGDHSAKNTAASTASLKPLEAAKPLRSTPDKDTEPQTSEGRRSSSSSRYGNDDTDLGEDGTEDSPADAEDSDLKTDGLIEYSEINDMKTLWATYCQRGGDFTEIDAVRRACELGHSQREHPLGDDQLERLISHFQQQIAGCDFKVLIHHAYQNAREGG